MTENNDEANMALLLDEKIEERIHIAVGKLFGFDVTKNYFTPPAPPGTFTHDVHKYVMQEVTRQIGRLLVNEPQIVRELYERMAMVQRDRRQQHYSTTTTSSLFF